MKRFSFIPTLLAAGWVLLAAGCAHKLELAALPPIKNPTAEVKGDSAAALQAGFAKQAFTPRSPVFLAGFNPMRLSYGAHDDLMVRTLVLKQGSEKLALVAVDAIGIQRTDILAFKAGVPGFRPDQILIASTHTHSGRDTLGLWGLPPVISGRSSKFMKTIGQAVAATIRQAEAAAVPVQASTAVWEADPSIMVNDRQGEPEDHHMGLMVFRDPQGNTVATLWNAVGHPETMFEHNHYLTADYPGRVSALVEQEYGGGAIFFNGALGAMMTPAHPQPGQKADWPRLERVSQQVFAEVKRGMGRLEAEKAPRLVHRVSEVVFPAQNDLFVKLMQYGILSRQLYEGKQILTEVNLIEIGSAQFVTFPGEDYPKQGLAIRRMQKAHAFQIGLADDELGYILYPKDYGTKLYEYETTMCAGPELSQRLEQALTELLKE